MRRYKFETRKKRIGGRLSTVKHIIGGTLQNDNDVKEIKSGAHKAVEKVLPVVKPNIDIEKLSKPSQEQILREIGKAFGNIKNKSRTFKGGSIRIL